jgi:hypothetical protein
MALSIYSALGIEIHNNKNLLINIIIFNTKWLSHSIVQEAKWFLLISSFTKDDETISSFIQIKSIQIWNEYLSNTLAGRIPNKKKFKTKKCIEFKRNSVNPDS